MFGQYQFVNQLIHDLPRVQFQLICGGIRKNSSPAHWLNIDPTKGLYRFESLTLQVDFMLRLRL